MPHIDEDKFCPFANDKGVLCLFARSHEGEHSYQIQDATVQEAIQRAKLRFQHKGVKGVKTEPKGVKGKGETMQHFPQDEIEFTEETNADTGIDKYSPCICSHTEAFHEVGGKLDGIGGKCTAVQCDCPAFYLDDTDDTNAYDEWWKRDADTKHTPTNSVGFQFPGDQKGFIDGTVPHWKRPVCSHPPQCVLKSTRDKWEVWAGKRYDCIQTAGNYSPILNCSGTSVREKHTIPIPELKKYEINSKLNEIELDWPDFYAVDLPYGFWHDLIQHLSKIQGKLLIFCIGGHGRTGTAVASLMVATGWKAKEAIEWVRKNYCEDAIESKDQERYIYRMEQDKKTFDKGKGKVQKKKNQVLAPINLIEKKSVENELDELETELSKMKQLTLNGERK